MSARERAEAVIAEWFVDHQAGRATDDVTERLEAAGLRVVEAGALASLVSTWRAEAHDEERLQHKAHDAHEAGEMVAAARTARTCADELASVIGVEA